MRLGIRYSTPKMGVVAAMRRLAARARRRIQLASELQRDWNREVTVKGCTNIVFASIHRCRPCETDHSQRQDVVTMRCSRVSGPVAFVKGFGRRLAFESLRRTNPRAVGARYGDLGVELGGRGRTRVGDRPWTAAMDVFDQALCAESQCEILVKVRGCKLFPRMLIAGHLRPQQGCDFATVHAAPDHGELRPGEHTGRGGARGWA